MDESDEPGFRYTWAACLSATDPKLMEKLRRLSDGGNFTPPYPEEVVTQFNRCFHLQHIDAEGKIHEGCSHPGEFCSRAG